MIAIIDYGAGNLRSVSKALDFLNVRHKITNQRNEIENADKLIFPGVGNFGDVISELKKLQLIQSLKKFILNKKPYLGICIGLQILFEYSDESPNVSGLGLLKGRVSILRTDLKIPHIGWNTINIKKKSLILKGIKNHSYFYFVHSYCALPNDKEIILTTTDYGTDFVSGIEKDNIYALQFHPEKSGTIGLMILKNFSEL